MGQEGQSSESEPLIQPYLLALITFQVCVVVDEGHMVSDPQRGLPLELSLSKLMFSRQLARLSAAPTSNVAVATGKAAPPDAVKPPQIVCMSATMGGLSSMCEVRGFFLFSSLCSA